MFLSTRAVRGVAVFALIGLMLSAANAFAQTATTGGAQRDRAAVAQANASIQAAMATARSAASAAVVAGPGPTKPNDVFPNPNRAYPPSCLGDGLPFGEFRQFSSDPAPLQQQLVLPGDIAACSGGNAQECAYQEQVTISVWRVPCSGGTSATLMQIDRPCGGCANTSLYPTFPLVLATQGNKQLYIRLATDPNTWFTTSYANEPIGSSNIWVLENFYGGAVQFDYNQAFALALDNTIQFNVPAYQPAQYTGAQQSLPISGYMTSNWFDPNHGGEGTLTQIFDNNDGATRTFTSAWYTFDTNGLPFWLYSQGSIKIGDRTTGPVDTFYATNGGFAGNFNSATFTKWGTITFSFPDCNHMAFTYNGNADAVQGPTGSGQRTWLRIANVNSIACN
jgi:hypothetical protein